MNDAAQSPPKVLQSHLAVTVVVAGALIWADGRLWPFSQIFATSGVWFFLCLQMLLGPWAYRFRAGRFIAAIVNGALLWQGIGWARSAFADSERRPALMGAAAIVSVWIVAALVWRRLPNAWKEGYAESRLQRAVDAVMSVAVLGGLVGLMLTTALGGLGPGARWGVAGAILAMAAGLGLALWRLDGWPRAWTCWAILSLAWIALMTGLAATLGLGAVQPDDWLLALLPPAIVGAVMAGYWRVYKRYGV